MEGGMEGWKDRVREGVRDGGREIGVGKNKGGMRKEGINNERQLRDLCVK